MKTLAERYDRLKDAIVCGRPMKYIRRNDKYAFLAIRTLSGVVTEVRYKVGDVELNGVALKPRVRRRF